MMEFPLKKRNDTSTAEKPVNQSGCGAIGVSQMIILLSCIHNNVPYFKVLGRMR